MSPETGDFEEEAGRTPGVRVESPFPLVAVPRVWTWIEEFHDRIADDYGPKTLDEFVESWRRQERTRRTWGVWRGAELGGLIIWQAGPIPEAGETHALFKREFWGRATTRAAAALVYAELFGEGVRKIMAFPFASNRAVIALALSLGFVREGMLREQTLKKGQPVDVAVLGLLRKDFEALLEKEQECHRSPSEPRSSEAESPPVSPATEPRK